jgi:tape measure domain-containing protein
MATNKDVQIKLTVDSSKFASGIASATNSLNQLKNSSTDLSAKMTQSAASIQNNVQSLQGFSLQCTLAGTALAGLVGYSLKAASDIEQLAVSFEVLAGGKQIGDDLLNSIKQFSAVTPFVTQGLAKNAQMLLAYGSSVNEIMPTLKLLGDVSGGNQQKMDLLALAYGQVMSQGRLLGQDLRQMTNLGFNPLNEIAQATGKSMAEVKEMMSQGAISSDMVTLAFKRATTEGGRFHNMMDKQSQTLYGRFSTLVENVQQLGQAFGAALAPAALKVVDIFITLTAWATKLPQPIQATFAIIISLVSGFLLLAGITPTIIKAFEAMKIGAALLTGGLKSMTTAIIANTAAFLTNPFGQIVLAITALIAAIIVLIANWDKITAAFKRMAPVFTGEVIPAFKQVVDAFTNGMGNILEAVTSKLSPLLEAGKKLVTNIMEGAQTIWGNFTDWVSDVFGGLMDTIGELIAPALEKGKDLINFVLEGARSVWDTLVSWITTAFKGLIDVLKSIAKLAYNVGRDFINWIWNGIKAAFPGLATAVKNLATSLGNLWNAAFNKTAKTNLSTKVKADTSGASSSIADLDKQIQAAMGAAGGTGGKTKKTKSGKSADTLANEEISSYKKVIDEKTKLMEQFEALQLSLGTKTVQEKTQIELDSERKKQALLITELEKLGISKQQIEGTQQDQLYAFDLTKFSKTNKEKIKYLTEHLNECKINTNKYLEEIAQAERTKYKETLAEKQKNDDQYFTLLKSKNSVQNAWLSALGINTSIQNDQLEIERLNQKLLQQRELLTQFGLSTQEIARLSTENINSFDLSRFDETKRQEVIIAAQAYQQIQADANNANGQITADMLNEFKTSFNGVVSAGQNLFSALTDSSQNWFTRVSNMCSSIISLLNNALSLMSSASRIMSTLSGGGGGGIFGSIGKLFGFASGGIIPGAYSQSQIIQAHGSEMVLNPSQQAQLFAMANGATPNTSANETNGTGTQSQQPVIIFNQTFSSLEPGTAAQLVKDQMPYVKAQVLEAINTQSSWRGAIKRANG